MVNNYGVAHGPPLRCDGKWLIINSLSLANKNYRKYKKEFAERQALFLFSSFNLLSIIKYGINKLEE